MLAAAGCGDGGEDTASSRLSASGASGVIVYALPALPPSLDPMAADSRGAQLVSRQVHEPLVSAQRPPFGTGGPQRGLALSAEPSAGATVWRLTLRQGVRFQDGSPFNASAVLANTRRWARTGATDRLLPGLFAVDAPRPGEVRFLFSRAQPDAPRLLASPRLGIVSPQALAAAGGELSEGVELPPGSGTGPFALGERDLRGLVLDRNEEWWGTPAGLGPGLDAVEFVPLRAAEARLQAVLTGEAQIAEPLAAAQAARARGRTLVRVAPLGAGRGVAVLEASVRGFAAGGRVPALSGLWLTRIGA